MKSTIIITSLILVLFFAIISLPNVQAAQMTARQYLDQKGNQTITNTQKLYDNMTRIGTPTKYNVLDVLYSQSCQTMIDHHLQTSCPTLDKIWKYDTSNTNISGKLFLKLPEDKWIRTNPQIKNHYIWYDTTTVCVDCKASMANPDVIKTIFIEPSDFVFIDKNIEIKNSLTWVSHVSRYVSENCNSATIAYSDYLLNDTIRYMLSGCKTTSFNGDKINTIKDTPFVMNSPYASLQHYIWLPIAKKANIGNCITHTCPTIKNPYKKSGWN